VGGIGVEVGRRVAVGTAVAVVRGRVGTPVRWVTRVAVGVEARTVPGFSFRRCQYDPAGKPRRKPTSSPTPSPTQSWEVRPGEEEGTPRLACFRSSARAAPLGYR
jgi:hypothetical protein